MYKACFFHGLESSLPSGKVEYLKSIGWVVFAEKIDYKSGVFYQKALNDVIKFEPNIVIGSSMGGLLCKYIACELNIPMILLNPALNIQKLTKSDFPQIIGNYRPPTWALLGIQDDIVPFDENYIELQKLKGKIIVGNHGHRTSSEVFRDFINKIQHDFKNSVGCN